MSERHPYGKAIKIISFGENRKIIVDQKSLKKLFLHKDVKNRSVVVLSIVGAFRKGKSFLLNYCLRFLYANYPSINYPENPTANSKKWMGGKNEPLTGFSWRSGTTRDTSGIVMWSDVFLCTDLKTGDDLAIFVMDTQGLFDNQTTEQDNSRIFALGTLISSIEVLNLLSQIQENQLQYLEFATKFARFALNDNKDSTKPFQNLMFLIRDWPHICDHAYGMDGGSEFLKKVLSNKVQNPAIQSVRDNIVSSFENLSCSLLPFPGKLVANGSKKLNGKIITYNGNWSETEGEFKDHLKSLIEFLLKPDQLVPKKINGEIVNASEFLEYIQDYFKKIESDQIPEAKSIYELTIQQQLSTLVKRCFGIYKEFLYKNEMEISSPTLITMVHDFSRNKALMEFEKANKMGNKQHEDEHRKSLESKITDLFNHWNSKATESVRMIQEEREKTLALSEERARLIQDQREKLEKLRNEFERVNDENKHLKNTSLVYEQELNKMKRKRDAEEMKLKKMETDKMKFARENAELKKKIAAENEKWTCNIS